MLYICPLAVVGVYCIVAIVNLILHIAVVIISISCVVGLREVLVQVVIRFNLIVSCQLLGNTYNLQDPKYPTP